jgi:ABC-type branched-subunit amino acid transport system ATPase component
MKTILGLVRPNSATVQLFGRRIHRLPHSVLVRSGEAPGREARRLFPTSRCTRTFYGGLHRKDPPGSGGCGAHVRLFPWSGNGAASRPRP